MAAAAKSPWPAVAHQAWLDLLPFPGRFGQAWRVALLCALVAGVAMLYKVPEAAIGCYLVIYLARPDGAECVGQGIGLIILASIVVLAMAPVIQVTANYPLLRIAVIAGTSFVFVYLGAASQLGEIGSIIALVIAFILTLVDDLPAGEIATRGLLYAWQMAVMPMALMIVFNMVLGTSPHRLLRATISTRLQTAAAALDHPNLAAKTKLRSALADGNGGGDQQLMLARVFHTAPTADCDWLQGALTTSYQLLLAVAALPATAATQVRGSLAGRCREAAAAVAAGGRPPMPSEADGTPLAEPEGTIRRSLAGLAQADGGTRTPPAKPPFFASDALTNPDYQRFALKTTAAALTCYIIYSLINWQGIHTAMVTCYVAALGTTGETVHKLVLRISGCLVGAALGFGAILFVIPHLSSVGGLMGLVFCGVLVGSWVSAGNERISYAGVQVGLAFLLTIISGFAPSLDMDSGRDRIVGILLGNVVVYLIFTGIWPKSAVRDVHERLARALAAAGRLAGMDPAARLTATSEAALVETEVEKAKEQLRLLPFEPKALLPSRFGIARLELLVREVRALLPQLIFAPEASSETARRLAAAAATLDGAPGGPASGGAGEAEDEGAVLARARRIQTLAAG